MIRYGEKKMNKITILLIFAVSIAGCQTTGNSGGGTPMNFSFQGYGEFQGSLSGCRVTGVWRNTSGKNLPYITVAFTGLDKNRITIGNGHLRFPNTVPNGGARPTWSGGSGAFSGTGMGFYCSNIVQMQAQIFCDGSCP